MTSLVLSYPRDDAKTLVKAAFENTRGIEQYHDDGHRVVGKTGMGLSSYGERVVVELPETQASDGETVVSVTAEKEVSTNITATPDKYQSRFLEQLEAFRGESVDDVVAYMSERVDPESSKEVARSDDLRDGSASMGKVMVAMLVVFFLFGLLMMAAVMP